MEDGVQDLDNTASEWREILSVAFDLGLPSLFDLEWVIDSVERDEWGGLWW